MNTIYTLISKDEAEKIGSPKYFTGEPCKHGHVSQRYTKSSCCCECAGINSWSRFKDNPDFILKRRKAFKKHYKKNRTEILRKTTIWEKNNPERKMLAAAKQRSKQKKLPFNIDLTDIVIPTHCPVLGIEIKREGKRTDHSPTIDRINSLGGYTKDNVVIISWKANRIKNNATLVELQKISEFFTTLQIPNRFLP